MSLTGEIIELLLFSALLAAASLYLLNQVRKPSLWLGRFFLWVMNTSHSTMTDWGLKNAQIQEDFTILDVGCGGGRTIEKLTALAPKGVVHGVDYADGSVASSRRRNAQLIQLGRVKIWHASVSQLPFPANKFDLITAVETQYYWPNLIKDMQEVLRVLKPGGVFIVTAENYKKGTHEKLQRPVMKLLQSANLTVDEQRELFLTAGYIDVK
jgi:ubiquinone/menaquinone biosynthesis C-methylase UbiE